MSGENTRQDAGYTLTEVVVAAALFLLVMGSVTAFLGAGLRAFSRMGEHQSETMEMEGAISFFTRQIEQATGATPTRDGFSFVIPAKSGQRILSTLRESNGTYRREIRTAEGALLSSDTLKTPRVAVTGVEYTFYGGDGKPLASGVSPVLCVRVSFTGKQGPEEREKFVWIERLGRRGGGG